MNKKRKHLLTLSLCLLALLGVFCGLQKYNERKSQESQEEGIILIDVAEDEVVSLSYDYEGVTYSFVKKEDVWYYEEDETKEVTQYLITNMIDKLTPLIAEQAIEEVTDMSQYGLTDDVRTIHYETSAASYILEVGNYNSVSGVYYIRKPSDTVVYTVPAATITVFNKAKDDIVTEVEEEAETEYAAEDET